MQVSKRYCSGMREALCARVRGKTRPDEHLQPKQRSKGSSLGCSQRNAAAASETPEKGETVGLTIERAEMFGAKQACRLLVRRERCWSLRVQHVTTLMYMTLVRSHSGF